MSGASRALESICAKLHRAVEVEESESASALVTSSPVPLSRKHKRKSSAPIRARGAQDAELEQQEEDLDEESMEEIVTVEEDDDEEEMEGRLAVVEDDLGEDEEEEGEVLDAKRPCPAPGVLSPSGTPQGLPDLAILQAAVQAQMLQQSLLGSGSALTRPPGLPEASSLSPDWSHEFAQQFLKVYQYQQSLLEKGSLPMGGAPLPLPTSGTSSPDGSLSTDLHLPTPDVATGKNLGNAKNQLFKGRQSLFSPDAQNVDSNCRRFASAEQCKDARCLATALRDHYHCSDCDQVFGKRDDMIRHMKWHKKRDESLQHGFMRYSPTDDCDSTECAYNRKQTHYHCIQANCNKVYISTSDVQMHANYHRKDAAIYQEGFQRYRATEDCASHFCAFRTERTTHFHCRRPTCTFTFKNKADMEKHKSHHQKNDEFARDGFKKFMKYECCPFAACKFSKQMNHIHCIRDNCDYVVHSSSQILSHKRKHERRLQTVTMPNVPVHLLPATSSSGLQQQQHFGGAQLPVSLPAPTNMTLAHITTTSGPVSSMPNPSDIFSSVGMPRFGVQSTAGEEMQISSENESSDVDMNEDMNGVKSTSSHDDIILPNAFSGSVGVLDDDDEEDGGPEEDRGMLKEEASLALSVPKPVDSGVDKEIAMKREELMLRINQLMSGQVEYYSQQMQRYTANDACQPHCELLYKDHYHCTKTGCTAFAKAKERVREHARQHIYAEAITEIMFRLCEESACAPGQVQQAHYHCSDVECGFITSVDAASSFVRLNHYRLHDRQNTIFRNRKRSASAASIGATAPSSSAPSLATNSASMLFAKRRGRPPKMRDQVVVPRCIVSEAALQSAKDVTDAHITREMFLMNAEKACRGIKMFQMGEICHDEKCLFANREHYHCCLHRCYHSTDSIAEVNVHSKDFHRNVIIQDGFEYFDRNTCCRRPHCTNSRKNNHYHCVRENCDYSFVRHNTMAGHARKHEEEERRRMPAAVVMPQLLGPAMLDSQSSAAAAAAAAIGTVRSAGTYYPMCTPAETDAPLDLTVKEPVASPLTMPVPAPVPVPVHVGLPAPVAPVATLQRSLDPETQLKEYFFMANRDCNSPWCKLKKKNHYHCPKCKIGACDAGKMRSHINKHLRDQQNQRSIPRQQPQQPVHLLPKPVEPAPAPPQQMHQQQQAHLSLLSACFELTAQHEGCQLQGQHFCCRLCVYCVVEPEKAMTHLLTRHHQLPQLPALSLTGTPPPALLLQPLAQPLH